MAMLFAATYPKRVRALILYGSYAHFHSAVAGGTGGLHRQCQNQLGHRVVPRQFRAVPAGGCGILAMVGAL